MAVILKFFFFLSKKLLFIFILCLILSSGAVFFLLATPQGSLFTLNFLLQYGPKIQVQGIQGSFIHGLSADTLNYQDADLALRLKSVKFSWDPQALLEKRIELKDLSSAALEVQTKSGGQGISHPLLSLENVQLSFSISQSKWSIKGQGNISFPFKTQLKLSGDKPWLTRLSLDSLTGLEGLSPEIKQIQGELSAEFSLDSANKLNTLIELKKGAVFIPRVGLALQPINLSLKLNTRDWELSAQAMAKDAQGVEHALNLAGKGALSSSFQGKLILQGQDFPLINTKEYQVFVSPDLSFELAQNLVKTRGSILIPQAKIKPLSFSSSQSLSDDVVFVSEEAEKKKNYALDTDIRIEVGEKVSLELKGLEGYLDGGLRLQQKPQGPLLADGTLSIREGRYQAYGQDLILDQGLLLFSGENLTNPGLEVRAVRQLGKKSQKTSSLFDFNSNNLQNFDLSAKTTVGIEVLGHLKTPKIRLFSIPANLTEADILSLLLLGKPASQANQAGGEILLAAVSALHLDSGTKGLALVSQLKNKLGIDFNVESNPNYATKANQNGQDMTVVISKSLSKRLSLNYNLGIGQTDASLSLRYLLSKFFSLQLTSTLTGNGMDLLYSPDPQN